MNVLAFYMAALVLVASGAFVKGCSYGEKEAEAALAAKEAEISAAVEARRKEVAHWVVEASNRQLKLQEAITKSQAEIRTKTETIIERVPIYVPSSPDSNRWLTLGWVRVHDAAALGKTLPESPGIPVEAPAGIEASRAAEVVTENYGMCLLWREQVIGWQRWYQSESEKWNR